MKKGFTLIGLVISIIIISICSIPIAIMYQQASLGSFQTRAITIATALAEEKMEEVLRLGYLGISDAAGNFLTPFQDYSYQVIVHYVEAEDLDTPVDPTVTGYKNIELQVNHSAMGSIKLNSLLTNF